MSTALPSGPSLNCVSICTPCLQAERIVYYQCQVWQGNELVKDSEDWPIPGVAPNTPQGEEEEEAAAAHCGEGEDLEEVGTATGLKPLEAAAIREALGVTRAELQGQRADLKKLMEDVATTVADKTAQRMMQPPPPPPPEPSAASSSTDLGPLRRLPLQLPPPGPPGIPMKARAFL